jgi:hypothetical protein
MFTGPELALEEPLELDDEEVVDELDELPQALSATAMTPVRSKARKDLVCLCTAPPPEKGICPDETLNDVRRPVGSFCPV